MSKNEKSETEDDELQLEIKKYLDECLEKDFSLKDSLTLAKEQFIRGSKKHVDLFVNNYLLAN